MKPISADAQATLLLCSRLGTGLASTKSEVPLTPREWNHLALSLSERNMRPSDLLGLSAAELTSALDLPLIQAQRMESLLALGGQPGFELERLASIGVWVLTRSDDNYPSKLKARLGGNAPPVLFGAGDQALLETGFLAVVGSRTLDEAGHTFASAVGTACGRSGRTLVSGGAKGADQAGTMGCLSAGGTSVGVLAARLESVLRENDVRRAVADGYLTLVSIVHPKAGFSVGNAMARNKLIYCLADYGLVVSSDYGKGGTWTGATEVLRHKWVPLFVRNSNTSSKGNAALIELGAISFPENVPEDLVKWITAKGHAPNKAVEPDQPTGAPTQLRLF